MSCSFPSLSFPPATSLPYYNPTRFFMIYWIQSSLTQYQIAPELVYAALNKVDSSHFAYCSSAYRASAEDPVLLLLANLWSIRHHQTGRHIKPVWLSTHIPITRVVIQWRVAYQASPRLMVYFTCLTSDEFSSPCF